MIVEREVRSESEFELELELSEFLRGVVFFGENRFELWCVYVFFMDVDLDDDYYVFEMKDLFSGC